MEVSDGSWVAEVEVEVEEGSFRSAAQTARERMGSSDQLTRNVRKTQDSHDILNNRAPYKHYTEHCSLDTTSYTLTPYCEARNAASRTTANTMGMDVGWKVVRRSQSLLIPRTCSGAVAAAAGDSNSPMVCGIRDGSGRDGCGCGYGYGSLG